jgi:hypothetical protein
MILFVGGKSAPPTEEERRMKIHLLLALRLGGIKLKIEIRF